MQQNQAQAVLFLLLRKTATAKIPGLGVTEF
jgi:hypothetical protein